jgi:hypothetical protein
MPGGEKCRAEVWFEHGLKAWIGDAGAKLKQGKCKLKTFESNRKVQTNFGVLL